MLQRRLLGSSGMAVAPLSLGTVKFGRNQGVKYPSSFSLPSDGALADLLDTAQELGINLLDTAPAYGSSEERLGKILRQRGDRQQWLVFSKAGEAFDPQSGQSHYRFDKAAITASVEASLKRLKTDYLDGLLIHSDGRDLEIIAEHQVFATLAELKQRGLIRCGGMSTKTLAGGLAAIAAGDVAMITLNPQSLAEQPVAAAAAAAAKGVLIKKAFASGHLSSEPGGIAAAINLCLATPGVSSIVAGTINAQHLRDNAAVVAAWQHRHAQP